MGCHLIITHDALDLAKQALPRGHGCPRYRDPPATLDMFQLVQFGPGWLAEGGVSVQCLPHRIPIH